MKLFLNISDTIVESNIPQQPILDEIQAISDEIENTLPLEVNIPRDVMDSFKIKKSLNEDIWTNYKINPRVRRNLIKIANDFFRDLDLPKQVKIKDIIFTGSLANFNWSKYSDIDLHVVIDFDQFDNDQQIIDDFFYAQKTIWNQEHEIDVFGFPVEIYVQDLNTKLRATSVFSILFNKWVLKPKHEDFKIDKIAVKEKANKIIYHLKDIKQLYMDKQYQKVVDGVKKLKDKIKNMRNAGLENAGEFSLENIVFKVLRRTPFMDILDSYKAKAYDNLMSIVEQRPNEEILDEGEILDNTKFKYTRESEDEITIKAVYNGLIIGNLSLGMMQNAYYLFKDDFSEDQYYEIFPDDRFVMIGWLNSKIKKEGIARELMKRAIAKTKQQGYDMMYLNASPIGNSGLQLSDLVGFYKSFGFKEILNQGGNTQMVLDVNDF
jgi:predicted nucleotidyltransferase/GNAT superfamily N-acetyltransferase